MTFYFSYTANPISKLTGWLSHSMQIVSHFKRYHFEMAQNCVQNKIRRLTTRVCFTLVYLTATSFNIPTHLIPMWSVISKRSFGTSCFRDATIHHQLHLSRHIPKPWVLIWLLPEVIKPLNMLPPLAFVRLVQITPALPGSTQLWVNQFS